MLTSYLTAMTVIVLVMVAWVGVQNAWRRTFPNAVADPDVLAGRMGCHGCGCTDVCLREHPDQAGTGKEDNR